MPPALLEIDRLGVTAAAALLLQEVSLRLDAGERVAVVGASGAGKSVLAQALPGLLRPPAALHAERASFDGHDLLRLPPHARHALRGSGMFLVFQSPGGLLDPLLRIGRQLQQVAARAARPAAAVAPALDAVQLPRDVMQRHAHELSGGMKQRVLLAMALLLRPRLVIADEPTSSLDDDTAAGVLQALASMQHETRCALLLISHDLRLVQRCTDRVVVLDGGRLVEDARAERYFAGPASAAGERLLRAARQLGFDA